MRSRTVPAILLATVVVAAQPLAAQEIDAATGLTIGPGWELVRGNCGACHSYRLIITQQGDRQKWLNTIRWMQDTQNLWQFDPETEDQILSYLAEYYPPEPNRRRAPIPSSLMPPPATESAER